MVGGRKGGRKGGKEGKRIRRKEDKTKEGSGMGRTAMRPLEIMFSNQR